MRLWPSRGSQKTIPEIEITEQSTAGPRAIAVSSGKGGVGKTSISINLALCLAKMGFRVAVFDADLGMANAEVMLGLAPPYSLYDVLFGNKSLDDITVLGPGGISIISGGSGFLEMANLDQDRRQKLIGMLNMANNHYDFLLFDTAAGINKNVLGFVAAAGEVIVVATPEPTSLTDAYALIKVLSCFKVHSEVHIVINRAANQLEARRTLERLQFTVGRFLNTRINNLGWIPEDKMVSRAIKSQNPFFLARPNSAASRGVAGIAGRLTNTTPLIQGKGVWGKLVSLFG